MDLEAKDMVVVEGEKLHLNIPYRAIPTPKMVWQKDTVECKADDRLSMTIEMNSAHLELLKCTRADAGAYAISLENSLGTATGTVNVKVIGRTSSITMLEKYNMLCSHVIQSKSKSQRHFRQWFTMNNFH